MCGLAAALGGLDLRISVTLWLQRLALPLRAPCVHAVENESDWYKAAIARFVPIQMASGDSNALEHERERKSAAPAQADERDAAMTGGRPQGDADDGDVLDGRQCSACGLASPPMRPFCVCTPPPPACALPTAADCTQLIVSSRACGKRLVPGAVESWPAAAVIVGGGRVHGRLAGSVEGRLCSCRCGCAMLWGGSQPPQALLAGGSQPPRPVVQRLRGPAGVITYVINEFYVCY